MKVDWKEIERQILERLNLRIEAEALGIRFAGTSANGKGWLACHAIGRDDRNASASFCVESSNGALGRYCDHGSDGTEKAISLWDLAVKAGKFTDFQTAREHYAGVAGVELPGRKKAKSLEEQIEVQSENLWPIFVATWANHKPGVSPDAALRAGARSCTWHGKHCIAFRGFDPSDWSKPTTIFLFRSCGSDFTKVGELGQRKTHTVGGSTDGLLIVGTPEELAAATVVWKCEGPTDAMALAQHLPPGQIAVTNCCGAGSFPPVLAKPFAGKLLRIVHDADQAGEKGAKVVATPAVPIATDVRHVRLPYEIAEKHGKDLRDWFNEGHTFEELQAIADQAPQLTPADVLFNADGKRIIVIGTDERRVNDEAIAAIATCPRVYQRGGKLVHVIRDDVKTPGIERPQDSPTIVSLPMPTLRETLADVASFFKIGRRQVRVSASPPDWCYKAVDARGQWEGVRRLQAIVETPVLLADGTILQTPGYDAKSGLLYEPPMDFPPIPDHPTQAEARAAADLLLDVVCDFPFKKPKQPEAGKKPEEAGLHRAAWLAATLTPFARHAFHGPAPLFLIDANTRGTGKSLLTDVTSYIISGRQFPRTSMGDDTETRKCITSIAMLGENTILLDNIAGSFGNASLDSALTATSWSDRLLGRSEWSRNMPLLTTWFATGNNVQPNGDTARRICHVRLESLVQNPEERSGFKHPALLAWVKAERPRLVVAALTILRGFCAAGRPHGQITPWGSFEAWSDLVRSAVVWAGQPDPGQTRIELREQSDRDANTLRMLIDGWEEIDPKALGLSVGQAIKLLDAYPASYESLRTAFIELTPVGKGVTGRGIGRRLMAYRQRVSDGKYLDNTADTKLGQVWRVYVVESIGSIGCFPIPSQGSFISHGECNNAIGTGVKTSEISETFDEPEDPEFLE